MTASPPATTYRGQVLTLRPDADAHSVFCRIADCDRPVAYRGLCAPHYQAATRTGTLAEFALPATSKSAAARIAVEKRTAKPAPIAPIVVEYVAPPADTDTEHEAALVEAEALLSPKPTDGWDRPGFRVPDDVDEIAVALGLEAHASLRDILYAASRLRDVEIRNQTAGPDANERALADLRLKLRILVGEPPERTDAELLDLVGRAIVQLNATRATVDELRVKLAETSADLLRAREAARTTPSDPGRVAAIGALLDEFDALAEAGIPPSSLVVKALRCLTVGVSDAR